MKKNIFILLALIAAGCQKNEPVHTPEAENGAYAIEVTSPYAVESKTTLVDNGDYYSVNWTASDVIFVNGQESSGLTVDTGNAKKAVFTFANEVSAPYYSVYPASSYKAESLVDGQATVVIPAEQTYVEGDFDPAAAIMIGYSETAGKLAFEHAVAYMQIKVTTTDGAAVKSVSIKGNAKEAMSGEFTANFAEATLVNDTNDESSVSVVCESGFTSGKEVIIAIPARNYASGVSVTLTDVNGHSKLLKSTVAFEAAAGVVYSTEMELKPKGIWGVNDYIAFANAVNAGDYRAFIGEDGEVNLMADITLESGNFKYVSVEFNGTFDGNDHTLTSPSRTTPLFAKIGAQGVVKNLKTAGAFTSFANTSDCGASSFAKINYGLIEKCNNSVNAQYTFTATDATGLAVGCFVGANAGEIRDCINDADVTITANLYKKDQDAEAGCNIIMGGFAAVGHNVGDNISIGNKAVGVLAPSNPVSGKFTRCTNNGDIKVTVKSGQALVSAVGGICGLVSQDGVLFDGCVNEGNISRISDGEGHGNNNGANIGSSGIGGILGRSARSYPTNSTATTNWFCINNTVGYNTEIKGCTNSGIITHYVRYSRNITISGAKDSNENRQAAAGGVVGMIVGTSENIAKVTSCINTGTVYGGWSGQRHIIGGIAGYAKYAEFDANTMTGLLGNYTGVPIGYVGGIVGAAYEGVSVENGSSKPSFDCTGSTSSEMGFGLCVGCSLGNVEISNVKVGVGSTQKIISKTVSVTISEDNFEDHIYKEQSATGVNGDNTNYATTVTDVTWED